MHLDLRPLTAGDLQFLLDSKIHGHILTGWFCRTQGPFVGSEGAVFKRGKLGEH